MNEKEKLLKKIVELEPWFYSFDLGDGDAICSKLPENIRNIHDTRLEMVLSSVEKHFGDRLSEVECLDVGCHEGFFSFALANKVKRVKGFDVRLGSIEKAELVRKLKRVENVQFNIGDCYNLREIIIRPYELTLFLGVLYHLDNPIGALRSISEATKELCIIETQIIDDTPGETEWGSRDWHREYKGTFAIIDERSEYDSGNAEAGSYGLSLCPSMSALRFMLEAVGFKHIEVVPAPAGGYEQLVRGKRVVVSASK